jgi:hypothetical protein
MVRKMISIIASFFLIRDLFILFLATQRTLPNCRVNICSEIVAIISHNCPAQVNGASQSLLFFPDLGIHHVPCFNHMVQLVFTHAVFSASVALIIAMANDVITDLQTPDGITIMCPRCPTLVTTR